MKRRTSKLKVFVLIFVILILIAAALHTTLMMFSAHRLRAQMASKKILTVEDIKTEKVPDNENAAVVVNKIIEVMQDPVVEKNWRFLTHTFMDPEKRAKNPDIWNKAREASAKSEIVITLTEQAVNRPKFKLPYDYNQGLRIKHRPRFW